MYVRAYSPRDAIRTSLPARMGPNDPGRDASQNSCDLQPVLRRRITTRCSSRMHASLGRKVVGGLPAGPVACLSVSNGWLEVEEESLSVYRPNVDQISYGAAARRQKILTCCLAFHEFVKYGFDGGRGGAIRCNDDLSKTDQRHLSCTLLITYKSKPHSRCRKGQLKSCCGSPAGRRRKAQCLSSGKRRNRHER